MSLAVLADHMASKGRGPDSMLIHMSPTEVQGLQALAMSHGGSLTINPETGLPEAGFLDKLLPAIIGFAINAVAPGAGEAVAGLWGGAGGAAAGTAALVGGAQAIRTGDIGKGLQAGLGAYGGANLASGIATAGVPGAIDSFAATAGAEAERQALSQGLSAEAAQAIRSQAIEEAGNQATAQSVSRADVISKGFDAAKANPGQFAKDNWRSLAGVAVPAILAGENVKSGMPQTVTKPGMIAHSAYDPYSGTFVRANPYETQVKSAASGGIMGFDESSNSPMSRQSLSNMQDAGGMFNYAHDSGGIMKMAKGGIAHYAIGGDTKAAIDAAYAAGDYAKVNELAQTNKITAADVADTYKGFDTSGLAGLGINLFTPPAAQAAAAPVVQAQTANTVAAAPTYTQYTDAQIGSYLSNPANQNIDINKAIVDTHADPAAVNRYIASLTSPFVGSTADTRGSGTLGIYNQMVANSVDPDEYYKAALANDPKYAGWSLADIKRGYKLDEGAYALSKKLSGNVSDKDWAKFMDEGGYSVNDMAQAFGLSTREVQARYDLAKAKSPIVCGTGYRLNAAGTACEPIPVVPPVVDKTCPTGYHWDAATNACVPNISSTQNTTTTVDTPTNLFTAPSTSLPVGIAGNTGPSQIGGGATINPNGTITTSPRIPGIPVGGFTGMEQVRDAYTKGGGSLGYIPYAPKTMDEFDKKYTSKLTGGSKQAYDYLSGKIPYSPTPYTPTGQVMKPYAESVLGIPSNPSKKMYIFDPDTKQYKINPDYAIPTYDSKGNKTYNVTNKDVNTYVASKPSNDDFYKWAKTNNLSIEQIAAATGMPITEVQKMFSGGAPADTTATTTGGTSGSDNYTPGGPFADGGLAALTMARGGTTHQPFFSKSTGKFTSRGPQVYADGGMPEQFNLGGYSDGGRLLRGPGDGVSDSIPATIGNKRPARLADGEFVVPARIVSELGNGSTEAGARKLYAMMDRVQSARRGSIGKGKVANNSRADKYLPA